MKHLVLTIAMGTEYIQLAALTHPTIRRYAERIGADFHCINTKNISVTTPHWEKFQIAELLDQYDRILYVDTDIIIRDDCPNLFRLVPSSQLGMFNEANFTDRSKELLIDVCRAYGVTLPYWDGRYFNSGVMVISKIHKSLFIKPEQEVCNFYEQTYLNMQIAFQSVDMFELPYQFNRMSCMDNFTGEHRLASYIVHYAGVPNTQMLFPIIRKDLWSWEEWCCGEYNFTQHIHVVVSGGLGDQVNAQPAIRFMKQYVYPDAHITISTHHPQLFQHLDVDVVEHSKFTPESDIPYYTVQSLPPPESVTWMVLSNLLCHTVDYCSAALLRRILPIADKRVKLPTYAGDFITLSEKIGITDFTDVVIVHAGRHWNTKTFPLWWWQDVVSELTNNGFCVCLIGQDDGTRGVVPVECPSGGLDLRNKLSLGELIALLSVAPMLISNDSAPIHLAGAFDNSILLIPSCKHPEHVLPFRHGSVYWNASAPYKRLTIDDVSSRPTDVHGSSAEFEVEDWTQYLPEVEDVVRDAVSLSGHKLMEMSHADK